MSVPFQNSALSNTPVWIRTAPLRLFSLGIFNPAAAISWVQLFDVGPATAPALGTAVPTLQFGLNTLTTRDVVAPPDGWVFQNGLWAAATTLAGGSVAPATPLNVDFGFGQS